MAKPASEFANRLGTNIETKVNKLEAEIDKHLEDEGLNENGYLFHYLKYNNPDHADHIVKEVAKRFKDAGWEVEYVKFDSDPRENPTKYIRLHAKPEFKPTPDPWRS